MLVDSLNSPLEVSDLDVEVNAIGNPFPPYGLPSRLELARLSRRLYDYKSNVGEPYEVREIVLKAEITAGDVKEQMAKQLRTMYYTAKQLEEQYAVL